MALTASGPALLTRDPLYFESIYRDAAGDAALVPWEDGRASPSLVNWLNAVAPSIVRCGARVAVVGCGLGSDARELIRRGFDVTAFDCSATAIHWAQRLDAGHSDRYHVADLFSLPGRWQRRFDLVVEINTLQAIDIDARPEAARGIASLVGQRGHLLLIARHSHEPVTTDQGPPWPLTTDEVRSLLEPHGLRPVDDVSVFLDDESPPVRRLRALFARTGAP